jgi:Transcriptional regulator, AbiEi antitoxin, Type IV TA system
MVQSFNGFQDARIRILDRCPGKAGEALVTNRSRCCQRREYKVKKLFFFFADRHSHAWLKLLKNERFDLGNPTQKKSLGGDTEA